jgi:hypothetical protein
MYATTLERGQKKRKPPGQHGQGRCDDVIVMAVSRLQPEPPSRAWLKTKLSMLLTQHYPRTEHRNRVVSRARTAAGTRSAQKVAPAARAASQSRAPISRHLEETQNCLLVQ